MSGYFTALNSDNLFVARKKDEQIDYKELKHLQNVIDRYGDNYAFYLRPDYSLIEALSIILDSIEVNKHLFFDKTAIKKSVYDFFNKYYLENTNKNFVSVNITSQKSKEDIKNAFNSVLSIQYSRSLDVQKIKLNHLMIKLIKALLTIYIQNEETTTFDNYWTTEDENEITIIDQHKASLFLESKYQFQSDIEKMTRF